MTFDLTVIRSLR